MAVVERTTNIVTKRIYFWKSEEVGDPPAVRTREIYYKNLISATLHADISFKALIHLDKISLNGYALPGSSCTEAAHRDYDATPYIQNGYNEVRLDYTIPIWLPGPKGVVTLWIDVTAEEITTPIEFPKLEWWQWLLIGGIGLVVAWGIVSYITKKG
jgi:hypothetical protein